MEIVIRLHNCWFSHFNRPDEFGISSIKVHYEFILVFSCDKIADKLAVYDHTRHRLMLHLPFLKSFDCPRKPSSVILVFTLFTIKCRSSFVSEGMLSCPLVLLLPCLAFTCLVKPPFDLQTFSQLLQGKDFLPDISHRASAISSSIVSSSPFDHR